MWHRTSGAVVDLFDMQLRALRRDRAARIGPQLFLLERTFEDCLERIVLLERIFERALLIGCPDAGWPARLRQVVKVVDVSDPGHLFAERAGGAVLIEDGWTPLSQVYDLVLAIGTLDTVNDLPRAMRTLSAAMRPQAPLIGAMSGGDTLPQLRNAMRTADEAAGAAAAHVHPRIEPSALAGLFSAAGFTNPVIDVDRVQVAYASLKSLVTDLRCMAATNVLSARPRRPIVRGGLAAAEGAFIKGGDGNRTTETFEILHFAAWSRTAIPSR